MVSILKIKSELPYYAVLHFENSILYCTCYSITRLWKKWSNIKYAVLYWWPLCISVLMYTYVHRQIGIGVYFGLWIIRPILDMSLDIFLNVVQATLYIFLISLRKIVKISPVVFESISYTNKKKLLCIAHLNNKQ